LIRKKKKEKATMRMLFVVSLLLCGAFVPAQAPPPLLQINSAVTVQLPTGLVMQVLWIKGFADPIVLPPSLPGLQGMNGIIQPGPKPTPSHLKATWISGKMNIEVYVSCEKYGKNDNGGCIKEFDKRVTWMMKRFPPS
jgi:hypothetical protein